MLRLLALDTSAVAASCAVVGDGGALLWTEHRARRAQRFFRCSA